MTVNEVQPTPNPNAMKIILAGTISDRPLSFFNAEAGSANPLAASLFAIPGVTSLLLLNDFVTVSKAADVAWRDVLPAIKKAIAAWPDVAAA